VVGTTSSKGSLINVIFQLLKTNWLDWLQNLIKLSTSAHADALGKLLRFNNENRWEQRKAKDSKMDRRDN